MRTGGGYGVSMARVLLRRRGELVERSFAHCYETGAMRRCHLRGQENIWKRQLIHVGAFNLSLILRQLRVDQACRSRSSPRTILVSTLSIWFGKVRCCQACSGLPQGVGCLCSNPDDSWPAATLVPSWACKHEVSLCGKYGELPLSSHWL